jgi:hypothetical protein
MCYTGVCYYEYASGECRLNNPQEADCDAGGGNEPEIYDDYYERPVLERGRDAEIKTTGDL